MSKAPWYISKTRQIRQRVVVEGELILQTPAHFGNGDGNELTDMPLLLDPFDNKTPLLTGASLAGALRGFLREQEHGYGGREKKASASVLLFGGRKADAEGGQSPLIIADSLGLAAQVENRSGVKLDGKTRTAEDKKLFDVQLWQAGTRFPLRFELLICQGDDEVALKRALATALAGLSSGRITLGARKRRGYGQVIVKQWRVREYDLTVPTQLCDWLKQGGEPLPGRAVVRVVEDERGKKSFAWNEALGISSLITDARHFFDLHATFVLSGSLLIRSGGGAGDIGPDMVHLHSYRPEQKNEMPILSGTSLAGALRARATRIANTLDKANQVTDLIYGMFGPDMNDGAWMKARQEKGVQASRVLVQETVVENGRADLVQNRVSIDRFTGGARETALFNQQPVWGGAKTEVTIALRLINPSEAEIGLLLLLLKDLWTGDLPLGGESSVGRGRLQGRQATLTHENGTKQEWEITAGGPNQLNFTKGKPADLQIFVDALQTQLTGGRS